jgi:hypothetical protein
LMTRLWKNSFQHGQVAFANLGIRQYTTQIKI